MVEMSAAASKALASAATAAGRRLLASRSHRLRTAWRAGKAAKSSGLYVTRLAIYTWLGRDDTRQFLGHASPNDAESALAALRLRLGSQATPGDTNRLLALILQCFISGLQASEATAVSHAHTRADISTSQEILSDHIADAARTVVERIDAGRTFEESLKSLNPWRAEAARGIRPAFPAIDVAVDSLAGSADRGGMLRDWSAGTPSWLVDAPPAVWTWLAEVSFDYLQPRAGRAFLATAIEAGADPRGFWQARRAQGLSAEDLERAKAELVDVEHPYAAALRSAFVSDYQTALDQLQAWSPIRQEDQALKALMSARLLSALGRHSEAIAASEAACSQYPESSGLLLVSAEVLLVRAANRESATKLHDAARALELAVRARNLRRAWNGDSTEAAVLALKAANMSGDPERAWRICRASPEGEATQAEAADQRLLAEAAMTAALSGRTKMASNLLPSVTDQFAKAQVQASLAEERGDLEESERHLRQAWDCAEQDNQQMSALMGLARIGANLPEHEDLKSQHPKLVGEIESVALVMSQPGDRLVKLRANAHKSMYLAVELANLLTDQGRHSEAATTLAKAAEQWGHPNLMSMAADAYLRGGDLDNARRATHSSLTLGGHTWSGRQGAQIRLVRISVDEHRWDLVAEAARGLVQLDPNDLDATWALVKALVQQGKLEEAWFALTAQGAAATPRQPDEATVWVNLHARYAPNHRYLSAALEVLEPWIDHEQVVGTFIPVLYFGLTRRGFEPDADELAALHAVQRDFLQRFPESTYFRAIPVGDGPEGLQQLIEELKASHSPAVDALFEQVKQGTLPLGAVTMIGRTYAEAVLHRAAGQVWSTDPDWSERPLHAPQDGQVILDTSAARTLNVLDTDIRDSLLGRFADVRIPDRLFRDAQAANDSMGLRASMNVAWDPEQERPMVTEISEADQARLTRDAQELMSLLQRTTRVPVAEFRHVPNGLREDDWLSALELAAEEQLPVWCDDRALRQVAATMGVQSFSTTDLLRRRLAESDLTAEEFEVALAQLIHDFHIDLGFPSIAMELAANLDGWKATGAANAIRRPYSWRDPELTVRFLLKAMVKTHQTSPQDLTGWMASGCIGLVVIAGTPDSATANLRIFLERIFSEAWLGPDQLPFVLSGLRTALAVHNGTPDPLEPAVRAVFTALSETREPSAAQAVLMWLFSHCNDADQRLVARVILTS